MPGKRSSNEDLSGNTTPLNSEESGGDTSDDNTPAAPEEKAKPLDPTRYGDWEKNGRCIDF